MTEGQEKVMRALARGMTLRSQWWSLFGNGCQHYVARKGGDRQFRTLTVTVESLLRRRWLRKVRRAANSYHVYTISVRGREALRLR